MNKSTVAIVRYQQPLESVRRAVDLSRGLDHLPHNPKVYIKPNIVYWARQVPFPKFGVMTTSRVVEDMVVMLKDRGVEDITIGEGTVVLRPKDFETPAHAFETLGYNTLKKRYGIKIINVFQRPFKTVDVGDGVVLNFNADILDSDFVVNLPVLKTHAQTVTSLGIKNLKGMIDVESRKKCHGADPVKDLNFFVARLADRMPPMFTLIDGIYSNERGPGMDGRMRRSNLLVASADVLSADMVGSTILGYPPKDVPHLVHAANRRGRVPDLSDVEVVGEKIEEVTSPHEYTFQYTESNTMPVLMAKKGIRGVAYRKFDTTMCTYCSGLTGAILTAIGLAWKGEPYGDVEVLTGKIMKPAPGMKKTILLGQCMYEANKDDPNINELLAVKSCPPQPKTIVKVFHQAGIPIDPAIIENVEQMPFFYLKKYEGKPEFDDNFFRVSE